VDADLTDFPVLIDVTDSDLPLHAQPDGDDIAFTDSVGNQLYHEIESYSNDTGHLVAWVNVPFLSSTIDTTVYMYYGNPGAEDQQDSHNVWDSHNMMVQHLNEESGLHYDSTFNGNDGTVYSTVDQGTLGKIDGADKFTRVGGYVEVPHSSTISGFDTAFTASFWVKLDRIDRRQTLLNKFDLSSGENGWFIEYRNVERAFAFFASSTGTNYQWWYADFVPQADTWYNVVVVWQTNTLPKFYVDGQQVPTVRVWNTISQIYDNTGAPLHIGRCTYNSQRTLDGYLDEIRISDTNRSPVWIRTCYNNQETPSNFYNLGTQQVR
jgi:hypothetical protein